jgi:oxygen-independent coproporphyrinogen III oxidase
LKSIDSVIARSESMQWCLPSINVDFILGLPFTHPGETLSWIQELHVRYPFITHTSVYMLEDEAYPKHWKENSISDSELQDEFLQIIEYFSSLGWHHYELSNFAKPWYESIHNQWYWDHSDSRGFGLSAASYRDGRRWSNSSSFSGYYLWKRENEEILTPEEQDIERMMFWLRRDGWDRGLSGLQISEKKVQELIQDGLIEIREKKIKPTKTWIFLIDHIISELIADS